MKKSPLFRGTGHALAWIAMAGWLFNGEVARGAVTIYAFNKRGVAPDPLPPYDWSSSNNWFQTPDTGVPNAVDAIASLATDIGALTTLNLNGNTILGGLTIGDQNGSHAFVIAPGTGGDLTFQTSAGTNAVLNKVISGQAEQVNVSLVLGSSLDVNITTGTIIHNNNNLHGPLVGVDISGTGGLNKYGGGVLILRGQNTYTGLTAVNNGGNGQSVLRLETIGGNSIVGDIRIGNATTDGNNQARLELGFSNQIADTSKISFQGAVQNGSGMNAYFKLMGNNETIAGITDTQGRGIIENMESEVINTDSVLTINNTAADISYFEGFTRDKAGGAGTGTLSFVKQGAGILTLAGGNIRHSGDITITEGTLELSTTSFLPSEIVFNNGLAQSAKLVLDNSGDYRWMNLVTIAGLGATTIEKTGAGNLTLGAGQRVGNNANGNTTLSGFSTTQEIYVGMAISGTNIPADTIVTAVNPTSIVISQAPTGTNNGAGYTFTTGTRVGDTNLAQPNQITGINTAGLVTGMAISGAGIPAGTTITGIGGSSVTLSQNITSTLNNTTFTLGNPAVLNYTSPFTALDGTITVARNTVFGGGLTTDGANLTVNAGMTTTVTGNLNFTEGEILTQNGTLQVNGNMVLSGKASLGTPSAAQYTGGGATNVTGTLTMDNPNAAFNVPFSVGGAISLHRGTASISNQSSNTGALIGAYPSIAISGGGTLTLSGNGASNLVAAVPILSSGGNLTYSHGNGASEGLGQLNLQAGRTLVHLTSVGAGSTGTLNFAGITRSLGSTLSFTSTDSGAPAVTVLGGANKVIFGGAVPNNDGILGGFAREGNEWVTHSVGTGIQAYSAYTLNSAIGTWAATQNIKFNDANRILAINSTTTINSLNIQGSVARTITRPSGADTATNLIIDSGGIISSGATHVIGGTGTLLDILLSPSNGNAELFVNVGDNAARQLNIGATIKDNTVSVSLVKAGPGVLELQSNNTYTGKTFINEGTIATNADLRYGAVPSSFVPDQITLNGGAMRANQTFTLAANRGVTIGAGNGTIDVLSGQTLTIPSLVNGAAGVLFKTGAGSLLLSGSTSNLSGGVINNGSADSAVLTISGTGTQIGFIDHNSGTTTVGTTGLSNIVIQNIRMDGNGEVNITGGVTVQGEIRLNGLDRFNISGNNIINQDILFGAGEATVDGNNIYGGNSISLSGGTLKFISPTALNSPTPLPLVITNGIFALGTSSFVVGDLSGAGQVEAISIPSELIVDTRANSTYSGRLTDGFGGGQLNFTKRGDGVLTLSYQSIAPTDYTGATRIEGGVLDVTRLASGGSTSSIGASGSAAANLFIASGAALRYTGTNAQTTNRSFTIGAGSEGAAIIADGATRGATMSIGNSLFTSPDLAIDFAGGISTLRLGGYNLGDNVFNLRLPDIGDGVAVKKTGPGTWLLRNPNSDYTGETSILEGTLAIVSNNALGSTAGGTFIYGGRLDLRNVSYTTQEDLYLQGGNLAVTTGNSTWAGTVALNAVSTITAAKGTSLNISGVVRGHGGVNQVGEGTVILSGANTHGNDPAAASSSAFYSVSAGTLVLDYSSENNSKLGDKGTLILGGGRLGGDVVISGGSHDEQVFATSLGAGSSSVSRSSGSSRLFMNIITPASGATIDFASSGIATTDNLNTDNILGGYATIAGFDWARNGGEFGTELSGAGLSNGVIVALHPSQYVPNTWAAVNNTTVVSSNTQTNATTNTLRFNDAVNATVTLSGTNTIDQNAILMTPNVGANTSKIDGDGSLRAGSNATDLVVHQYSTSGLLHIDADITNRAGAVFATGLVKNGPGPVLLSGTNTYTGVTQLNEGNLTITNIANGGVTSAIGASTNAAGNLIFNGGTLEYAGPSATTDRGFTVNFDALINISRESSTLAFSGAVAGTDQIIKFGGGTLRLTGNATALTNYLADQGLITVKMNTANDRFASNLATLTMAGGTFEVESALSGDTANSGPNRTQSMTGGLLLRSGASEVRVSSSGLDGNSNPIVTTLSLGDAADPFRIGDVRSAGGTVLFTENPTNGGTANIHLLVPSIDQSSILPWAVYLNTAASQPGVKDFAFVNSTNNDVIGSDAALAHDIGSGILDPSTWSAANNPSEGVGAFNGNTGGNRSVNTLRYFLDEDSLVTITGQLDMRAGAILIANQVGDGQKTINGGTITSNLSAVDGTKDLILHNYNVGSTFMIGSTIVDRSGTVKVNLVQSGTGTTALFGSNTYTGNTFVHGGVLRLDSLNAIPGGIGTIGGISHMVIEDGVVGLNFNDFTRDLGTGAAQIEFKGHGGFAAYTADRIVNLGGAGAQVAWGLGSFLPEGSSLILSHRDSDRTVDFQNPIALGPRDRFVRVYNGSDEEDAVLSGTISGVGGIVKTETGTLRLPTANTHDGGIILGNGTIIQTNNSAIGDGVMRIGKTEDSASDDVLIWRVQTGVIANSVQVGNINSTGFTSIDYPTINNQLSGSVDLGGDVFVSPASGVAVIWSGVVSGAGGLTLTDGGTLRLEGNNTYGTGGGIPGGAIDGATILRAGTLVLAQNTSLGVGTVELGDAMNPVASAVDRATNGVSVALRKGTFDPLSNGVVSFSGPGAFHDVSSTFDGTTFLSGDVGKRLLIKDEDLNPERNGIYQIHSVDSVAGTMVIVRVADLDSTAEMSRGRTVSVANGTSAGDSFFLARTVATANTSPVLWKQDVSTSSPAVSLLVDGPQTAPVANAIDINATNGAGNTTIGGTSAFKHGTVEFTGPITLQSQNPGNEAKDVFFTMDGCAELILSGVISDAGAGDVLNFIKTGTGIVTLNAANTYAGFTEVRAGVLKLDDAAALPSGNLKIAGGVVGLTTDSGGFTRALGADPAQVQWTDSGGFAAFGTSQTVNVGASVAWNATNFVQTGYSLVLGANHADAKVVFSTAIDLGTAERTIEVINGPAAVEAELSGIISSGVGGVLNKTGHGTLLFSALNTHTGGTIVAQGTVQGGKTTVFGTTAAQVVQIGGASTTAGDALKLEMIGDALLNNSNVVVSNITVGNQNPNGTSSIDVTNGAGTTTVPDAALNGTLTLNRSIFVGPDTGALLEVNGIVSGTGGINVVDGGTVRLMNGTNNYGTAGGVSAQAIDGGTIVRDGTIEIRSATALGTTTVELGDAQNNLLAVDRASITALSDCGAVFNLGTFTGVETDFGGGSYTLADIGKRLLVKDEALNPERNGIYQITAVANGEMTLVRVNDFDASGEMIYGSTVAATNGVIPNQRYFLTGTVGTVNTTPALWRETVENPNVALLAGTGTAGTTIANDIDLNKFGGTGTTTLGGAASLTTGTVIFAGNVTMQSQNAGAENLTLDLTSVTGTNHGVILSGVISDADLADLLKVRKVEAGVATLTGNNTYAGGTEVNAGVLLVNNTAGSGTGTGVVTVSGANTVLGGSGTIAGLTTIGADAILQPGGAVNDGNGTFDSATESLAFTGGLTLAADSTVLFQLNGPTAPNYDQVLVTGGTLTIGSTPDMFKVLLNFTPVSNVTFNLLDWVPGLFVADSDISDQLDLPSGSWDTSNFHTTGEITFLIPEPGRAMLLLLGLLGILMRRRRNGR